MLSRQFSTQSVAPVRSHVKRGNEYLTSMAISPQIPIPPVVRLGEGLARVTSGAKVGGVLDRTDVMRRECSLHRREPAARQQTWVTVVSLSPGRSTRRESFSGFHPGSACPRPDLRVGCGPMGCAATAPGRSPHNRPGTRCRFLRIWRSRGRRRDARSGVD